MARPDDQFAIVKVPADPGPLRTLFTSNARMVGDFNAVMANIIGTRAQRDLRLYVARGDALLRAEQVLEQKKAREQAAAIAAECDKLVARFDAFVEEKEREALQAEADAQAQAIIDTYSIPDDLPELDRDADPPGVNGPSMAAKPMADAEAVMSEPVGKGEFPEPNLYPDPSEADGRTPDAADPEGKGWLPDFLKDPGTAPPPKPAYLKKPQAEGPQEPASIDL
jgi:hypothetical protein